MRMDVKIRKAHLNDIPKLVECAKRLTFDVRSQAKGNLIMHELLKFKLSFPVLWRKWISKWIRSRNGLVLVAEHGGEIIAYSLNQIKTHAVVYVNNKSGHIADLYTNPAYRNKGISTRLKNVAFAWFKKKGLKYATISVHSVNKNARNIYAKWGFLDFNINMWRKL